MKNELNKIFISDSSQLSCHYYQHVSIYWCVYEPYFDTLDSKILEENNDVPMNIEISSKSLIYFEITDNGSVVVRTTETIFGRLYDYYYETIAIQGVLKDINMSKYKFHIVLLTPNTISFNLYTDKLHYRNIIKGSVPTPFLVRLALKKIHNSIAPNNISLYRNKTRYGKITLFDFQRRALLWIRNIEKMVNDKTLSISNRIQQTVLNGETVHHDRNGYIVPNQSKIQKFIKYIGKNIKKEGLVYGGVLAQYTGNTVTMLSHLEKPSKDKTLWLCPQNQIPKLLKNIKLSSKLWKKTCIVKDKINTEYSLFVISDVQILKNKAIQTTTWKRIIVSCLYTFLNSELLHKLNSEYRWVVTSALHHRDVSPDAPNNIISIARFLTKNASLKKSGDYSIEKQWNYIYYNRMVNKQIINFLHKNVNYCSIIVKESKYEQILLKIQKRLNENNIMELSEHQAMVEIGHNLQTCPICWESTNTVSTTTCGHRYCFDCIEKLFDKYKNVLCPLCRKELEYSDITISISKNDWDTTRTRFTNVIEIIKSSSKPLIIVSRYSKLIQQLHDMMTTSCISNYEFTYFNTNNDSNNVSLDSKIILMSYSKNFENINCQFGHRDVIFLDCCHISERKVRHDSTTVKNAIEGFEKSVLKKFNRLCDHEPMTVYRLIMGSSIEKTCFNSITTK